MELAAALLALCGAALFCLLAAGVGQLLLRVLRLKFTGPFIELLSSIACGTVILEVFLFGAQTTTHSRAYIPAILIASAGISLAGHTKLRQVFHEAWQYARPQTIRERCALAIVMLVLLLEALCALAPISSSDAMIYFAEEARILRAGFRPNLFFVQTLWTGQNHLLIFLGLALGSEKLALALEFVGGALATVSLWSLARHWMAAGWAWLTALIFLVTPLVVWQISGAGGPDLWLAFGATVGVVLVADARERPTASYAALVGLIAGWIAGGKYTGCAIALSLLLAFAWETRSLWRTSVFAGAAVAAGFWPYARNFQWTGDPLFPFLARFLEPTRTNLYVLASLAGDTGAAQTWHLADILKAPLFSRVNADYSGMSELLGPLVLAFIPLLFRVVRNTPLWRATLIVWIVSTEVIGRSSGMGRFDLPLYPLALAACFAGVASLAGSHRAVRTLAAAVIAGSLIFWSGGLLLYARHALAESVGIVSRKAYLQHWAEKYPSVEFVNSTLRAKPPLGPALVFFVEDYYLTVPFLYANPGNSWPLNPDRFQSGEAWEEFFKSRGIAWVVRAPDYPPEFAATLVKLEGTGALSPVKTAEIRSTGGRNTTVTILRVAR